MRQILTANESNELLKDFFPQFVSIFQQSFQFTQTFMANDTENGITRFTPSFKAQVMSHYIMNTSANEFADHEILHPTIHNRIYGLAYKKSLFIRLKKLDDQLLPANFPTDQAIAVASQGEIDGFPSKPCILNLGYLIHPSWSNVNGIYLTCSKHMKDNHWELDVLERSGLNGELIFEPYEEKVSREVEELLIVKNIKKKAREGTNG